MASLFSVKKKEKEDSSAAITGDMYDPQNPFALGRKEFNDRYERLIKNAASWRKSAFAMFALLAVSVGTVLWMAQSVKVIPYIVQVDQHGYDIAVKPVEQASVNDDRIIIARLAEFIMNVRTVYADNAATMTCVRRAYNSVASRSPAQTKLDEWFQTNNPLEQEYRTVNVHVQSVLRLAPVSGDTSAATDQDLFAGFPAPVPQDAAVPDDLGGLEYMSDLPLGDEIYVPSPQEIQDAQFAQIWMDVQEDLRLRDIDRKAMDLVREFAGAGNAVPPTPGQNGAVTYNFGDHIPKIVCRMNRVTDISLQAGEQVTGVHMGDTVRWEIAPAKSGTGSSETVHVIIKPLMPDISTNLVVMTDKRTYNLDLMSSSTEFIPSVRFAYPEDTLNAWNLFMQKTQEKRQQNDETVLSENYHVEPEDLNFNYKIIRGNDYEWAPVMIFDDGVKTYIEMPEKFKSLEAPVVMFYEGRQQKLVNYRIKDRLYIIDRVMSSSPGKAALLLGQSRLVIQKLKGTK